MTAAVSTRTAQTSARRCPRTGPAQTATAQTRLRAYILRVTAHAFDTHAADGTLAQTLGGCLSAHDLADAVARMIRDSIPDFHGHDIAVCACPGCDFYRSYDWNLPDPVLVVAPSAAA